MKNHSRSGFATWWNDFWFRQVSAAGFGMMRVAFGLSAFVTMLLEWPNVERFYGPTGMVPHEALSSVVRGAWRFSLLDTASSSTVEALYIALLIALFCVCIGILTRPAMLVSTILLYSFHEYGSITLDGGDTLLRLIAFILVLAPCDRSFTLTNLWKRLRQARETGNDQPPSARTMPIWPYRLLLWQMILLYTASAIEKWSGVTWATGSAVAIVLHHGMFTRLSMQAADVASYLSPIISWFTLYSQGAWALLLPLGLLSASRIVSTHAFNTAKRTLLLCGLLVHGGILIFLDVGTFSLTVFTAYLGLLVDDDFRAIRDVLNRKRREPIVVLFDGRCGFCKRTILILSMLDWLHRLQFENYHDAAVRSTYAPRTSLEHLNREMHCRLPDGSMKSGFFAFRSIAWNLPSLWALAPILYIPGITSCGQKAYEFVAQHR